MTMKFGNFANYIVRNFVVIWEVPTKGYGVELCLRKNRTFFLRIDSRERLCANRDCDLGLPLAARVRLALGSRFASMRAWENADFGPPARNRKKIPPKNRFWPHPENREKNRRKIGKMAQKSVFGPFFPIFRRFFPYFPGEAKIDFSAILFPDFGPEARNRHSPRHTYSQIQVTNSVASQSGKGGGKLRGGQNTPQNPPPPQMLVSA